MAEALAGEGCNVELIARTGASGQITDCADKENDLYGYYAVKPVFGLRLIRLKNLYLYSIYVVIYARLRGPQLIYTRSPIIAFITSLIGLDTVLHCHGLNNFFDDLVFKSLFKVKHLKKVAVVSKGLKTFFADKYGIKSDKLQVISNGIDIKRFRSISVQKDARPIVGLPLDKKILCYTGSLYEGRGIDIIIKLSDLLVDCFFLVVGGAPEDVLKWNQGKNDNLLFVGHVSNNDIPLYLFSADILLMPYQKEVKIHGGSAHTGDIIRPLKLFEYMAASRPILASDLPGLREVLNDNNSVLVEPNDTSKWLDAINAIINNKKLASRLSINARNDAMAYTNDIIARQILANIDIVKEN